MYNTQNNKMEDGLDSGLFGISISDSEPEEDYTCAPEGTGASTANETPTTTKPTRADRTALSEPAFQALRATYQPKLENGEVIVLFFFLFCLDHILFSDRIIIIFSFTSLFCHFMITQLAHMSHLSNPRLRSGKPSHHPTTPHSRWATQKPASPKHKKSCTL